MELIPLAEQPSLTPPFDDPVLIFAIAILIFLVAPLLFERSRLPGIIGVIVAGAIIGPNGLGLLERDDTIILLGEVGLIYLMFIAGLEVDITEFIENRDMSVSFGLLSFAIPQVAGMAVGIWVLGFSLESAALFAAIFSSHTLLAYPVVNRLGIIKNEAVTAVIGGTIITDTLALLVLAVVTGAVAGELGLFFWIELSVGLALLFAGVWFLVPIVGKLFFRNLSEESYFEFLFVLAVLFVSAFLAEMAGVEHIIGAFLAGLALNRLIPQAGTLMNRTEFVGNALFIPFFLLSVGMLVDFRVVFGGSETLMIAGSIVVLLLLTKLLAVGITGAIYGFTTAEQLTMYGLSAGQAAAALAITLIGFDLGLFGDAVVNGVVLMILIVSVISPFVSERYGREIVKAEEQAEYSPGEAPVRVLVPLSQKPERMDELIEFAIVLRESLSQNPLYVLTVVQRDSEPGLERRSDRRARGGSRTGRYGPSRSEEGAGNSPDEENETASEVATVEENLAHAEELASAAEVPVETQIRIDDNVVTGIKRGIRENRISMIVAGWSGERRFSDRIFGNTIEQLLERTTKLVFITRFDAPLNVADRVVLVLPHRIASHPGFYEAVGAVKAVAEQLGVPLVCLVRGGDPERYERLVDAVDPETALEVEAIANRGSLESTIGDRIDSDDLVIAMSPRENARGWESGLHALPEQLTGLEAENVAMVYPAEEDVSDKRRFLRME